MQLSIPNTFTGSTLIKSADMNTNFAAIVTVLNGNVATDNFATFTGAVTWNVVSNVLCQSISTNSNLGALSISSTGALTSARSLLYLSSTAAQTAGDAGLHVDFSSTSSTIPVGWFTNSGVGHCLSLLQSGVLASSNAILNATSSAAQTTGIGGLYLNFSNSNSSIPLAYLSNAGSGAALSILSTGTGYDILAQDNTNVHFRTSAKGVEVLNQSTAQLSAISSPPEGAFAYDNTQHRHQNYNGSGWEPIGIPAGCTMDFAGDTAPAGWLLCNGSAVSRTTYAALFAAIGVRHGIGDGVTTFNLPDPRGKFLRYWDDGAGQDPNASTRTAAVAGTQAMNGTTTSGSNSITGFVSTANLAPGMTITGTGIPANTVVTAVTSTTAITVSQNATGSATVSLTFSKSATGNYVGSVQAQATAKNGLTLTDNGHSHGQRANNGGSGAFDAVLRAQGPLESDPPTGTTTATTGITLSSTDSETRPLNLYLAMIIKY